MLCAPTGPASSPEKSVPFCSIVSHSARKPWYTVGQLGNEMGQAPSAAQRRPVGSVPRSKYSTYVRYCRWVRWVSSSSSKRDGGFETRPYVQAGEARTVVQPIGWGSQDGRSTHRLGKPGRSFNSQAGEARTVVRPTGLGSQDGSFNPTGWGSQEGRAGLKPAPTSRLGKPGLLFDLAQDRRVRAELARNLKCSALRGA